MVDIHAGQTRICVQRPSIAVQYAPPPRGALVVPVAGPKGEPGATGGRLVFRQSSPSISWTITHALGAYPQVQVLDEALGIVLTQIEHADPTTVVVSFAQSTSGWAILE